MRASSITPHADLRGWRLLLAAILAAILAFAAWPALAQTQTPNAPSLQKPDPDTERKTDSSLPSTGENLSERLERSDGVIQPPSGVDPQMSVRPKDPTAGSSMPVIPPPGTPGGNPRVDPK